MKTKLFLFFAVTIFGLYGSVNALANPYKVNDKQIDALFESATNIDLNALDSFSKLQEGSFIKQLKLSGTQVEDKQLVAGVVALAMYFTGIGWIVPIHRFILGTGDKAGEVFFAYCITLSGCGVILFIDGIMLLVNQDDPKYIDNSKFIMW